MQFKMLFIIFKVGLRNCDFSVVALVLWSLFPEVDGPDLDDLLKGLEDLAFPQALGPGC